MRALLPALALLLAAPPVGASTRSRATEAAVQRHLGIFLTTPEFRDPAERVEVRRDEAEIWFLRPVTGDERDAALCEGARWLLVGRLDAADGIGQVFRARDALDRVTLVFFDVETDVDLDRNGRYLQKRNPTPHAKFTVSRKRVAALDPLALDRALSGSDCVQSAREVLDTLWVREQ
ncbi:MAG: hypothetical protein H6705_09635 [Myxococcales bacterium]|nr:hypothetical protein [Myxococcales bacterium]